MMWPTRCKYQLAQENFERPTANGQRSNGQTVSSMKGTNMPSQAREKRHPNRLAEENMPLARQIAARLRRRYTWVPMEDLYSYALMGLTLAANAFDPDRGVPFPNYASQKGMFWAIDEMRKDGVVRRKSSKSVPRLLPFTDLGKAADPDDGWIPQVEDSFAEASHGRMEARELCATLISRLQSQDRKLLIMYYADHFTFREIAKVFKISESSVCLRHKALLNKLQRMATIPPRNQLSRPMAISQCA